MAEDTPALMKLLNILVAPPSPGQGQQLLTGERNPFDAQLESNILQMSQALQSEPSLCSALQSITTDWDDDLDDIRWHFVVTCLKVLTVLKTTLDEAMQKWTEEKHDSTPRDSDAPVMAPDTLSFAQNKTLSAALQFIVCLGMCPLYLPGVGVPLSLRSGFACALQSTNTISICAEEKRNRLEYCTRMLLDIGKQSSLGSPLFTCHLGDILAGLCQLGYAPMPKYENVSNNNIDSAFSKVPHATDGEVKQTTMNSLNGNLNEKRNKRTDSSPFTHTPPIGNDPATLDDASDANHAKTSPPDTWEARRDLETLVQHLYTPLVVRELLVLQGGSSRPAVIARPSQPALPRAPPWLRHVVGRQLSALIMRSRGVENVLRGMLDVQPGSSTTPDWRRCDAVAAVLAQCPRSVAAPRYLASVGPQFVALLDTTDQLVARQFGRVAMTTMALIVQHHAAAATDCLWRPLLTPLHAALADQDVPRPELPLLLASADDVMRVMTRLHRVTSECEPQSALLPWLQPCARLVFAVLCASRDQPSPVRPVCSTILHTLLARADPTTALALVHSLAFPLSLPHASEFHLSQSEGMVTLHESVDIVCDIEGVQFVTRVPNSDIPDWAAFDVAADTLLSVITSLENGELLTKFFISLLKELTLLISETVKEETALRESVLVPGRFPRPECTPSGGGGGGHDSSLIDIEMGHVAEEARFARRMTLLTLLALLSEHLGPDAFSDVMTVLDFVQATLERAAQSVGQDGEELGGAFESETLTLALGLLTAVLGGAMTLTSSDRYAMERLLPLLKTFSTQHADAAVRAMAADLRVTIATHGAVTLDASRRRDDVERDVDEMVGDVKAQLKTACEVKPLVEEMSGGGQDIHEMSQGSGDKVKKECDMREQNNNKHLNGSELDKSNTDSHKNIMSSSSNGIAHYSQPLSSSDGTDITSADNYSIHITDTITHTMTKVASATGTLAPPSASTLPPTSPSGYNPPESYHAASLASPSAPFPPCTSQSAALAFPSAPTPPSPYHTALSQLEDPLLPVRGHALIALRRLITSRDPETLRHHVTLASTLCVHLEHDDSYIYLGAVVALAALAEVKPADTLPLLAARYGGVSAAPSAADSGGHSRSVDAEGTHDQRAPPAPTVDELMPELRMKLGEVLVKTSAALGDLLPAYRPLLVPAALSACRSQDELVRASAVANLGTLCRLLRFSLHGVLHEVLGCCETLLRGDGAVAVRRAAALFAQQLFQGLGRATVQVLGAALLPLYRLLRHTASNDADDVTRQHALHALTELDEVMKEMLFPKQTLTKHIHVLDAPKNSWL